LGPPLWRNKMLLIIKDMIGYRLAELNDDEPFDGCMYHLKSGGVVGQHQGFIPDITNIVALKEGRELRGIDDLFFVEGEDKEVYKWMEDAGFGVDTDLRIHRKVGAPFTKIKTTQIGPIIGAHMKWCEDNKKNPEAYPLNLLWNRESKQIGLLMEIELPPNAPVQGKALIPLPVPEIPEAEGEIVMHKDSMGTTRVALGFQGHYLMVNNYGPETKSVTMKLYKYVNDEQIEKTEAKEVNLVTPDNSHFITEFGVYKKSAGYLAISIDDFFPEEKNG